MTATYLQLQHPSCLDWGKEAGRSGELGRQTCNMPWVLKVWAEQLFSNILDQKSLAYPVSESRGEGLSIPDKQTNGHTKDCVSNIGYYLSMTRVELFKYVSALLLSYMFIAYPLCQGPLYKHRRDSLLYLVGVSFPKGHR